MAKLFFIGMFFLTHAEELRRADSKAYSCCCSRDSCVSPVGHDLTSPCLPYMTNRTMNGAWSHQTAKTFCKYARIIFENHVETFEELRNTPYHA